MIDEFRIYRDYIGSGYSIRKVIKSPLPHRSEKHKSFSTRKYGDHIYWKDFNYESPFGHDVYAFVAEMESIEREAAFELVIERYGDIQLTTSASIKQNIESANIPLTFNKMDLDYRHLDYFKRLFVDQKLIDFFEVTGLYSIKRLHKSLYVQNDLDFGFHYKIGSGEKSYRPFALNKDDKFRTQHIIELEGFNKLPRNGIDLILTKSYKDVICLRALGYFAVSTSSENSMNIIKKEAWGLKSRFSNIFRWGDPDAAGIRYEMMLKQLFPLSKGCLSIIAKDPSDILVETQNPYFIRQIIRNAA